MKLTTTIAIGATLFAISAGIQANAIDPLAEEVANQTWHSMSHKAKGKACDRNAQWIIRKHHSKLNKPAKRQLRKAYRVILDNC